MTARKQLKRERETIQVRKTCLRIARDERALFPADTPNVSINHDMQIQQMGRIYSAKELIAARALLSLPTPVVSASYSTVATNGSSMQSLANLSSKILYCTTGPKKCSRFRGCACAIATG